MMNARESIEKALHSSEPLKALREVALNFSAEGKSESEIYKIFEDFILSLRNNGNTFREADEELLMEVLDAITGWCHPSAQLKLPIYLEPDVAEFIRNYARQKNVETEAIVNEWLRSKIAVIQPAL
jgi:hypothetical protein